MKPEELMTLLHALLSNWEDERLLGSSAEAHCVLLRGAFSPAEVGFLPCTEVWNPLYAGLGFPVRARRPTRGMHSPYTEVLTSLHGGLGFPTRSKRVYGGHVV